MCAIIMRCSHESLIVFYQRQSCWQWLVVRKFDFWNLGKKLMSVIEHMDNWLDMTAHGTEPGLEVKKGHGWAIDHLFSMRI